MPNTDTPQKTTAKLENPDMRQLRTVIGTLVVSSLVLASSLAVLAVNAAA